jgi:hypothetical protein
MTTAKEVLMKLSAKPDAQICRTLGIAESCLTVGGDSVSSYFFMMVPDPYDVGTPFSGLLRFLGRVWKK